MILRSSVDNAQPGAPLLQGENRKDAIRRAQVQGIFDYGVFPFFLNGIISLSVSLIYYLADHGTSPMVYIWSVLNVTMLIGRLVLQIWLERDKELHPPEKILNFLISGAFLGGILWAFLPLQVPGVELAGRHTYLTLIIVGVAAGGLVRGVPNSAIAIAFSLPPVISVAGLLMAEGTLMANVLYVNVALYAVMLYRACKLGADNFCENAVMKQEATLLAQSLHCLLYTSPSPRDRG